MKKGVQLRLCKQCLWKSNSTKSPLLCNFKMCIYRFNKVIINEQGYKCVEFIDTITKRFVIIKTNKKAKDYIVEK